MRFEKINEHQVRCMLNAQDLAARKIAFGELRYGNTKTTELFREVVAQAVREYGFNEDELPLMIEAIPLGQENLMLIISAVEDAEELDPHFAKFSEDVDVAAGLRIPRENRFVDPQEEPAMNACVVALEDIDAVMEYAKCARMFDGRSLLYRNAAGGFYLVMLRPETTSPKDFGRFINSISEFGPIVPASAMLYAALSEHEVPVLEDPIGRFGRL